MSIKDLTDEDIKNFSVYDYTNDKIGSVHDIIVDESARAWLAEHGYDPAMGARPMARVIQENIKKPLADEILFGKLAKGGEVHVTEKDGELVLSFDDDEEVE